MMPQITSIKTAHVSLKVDIERENRLHQVDTILEQF
jgi:hypothetical protein